MTKCKHDKVVVAVGPLPPPMHGFAKVHSLATDRLRKNGHRVISINTAGGSLNHSTTYHFTRLLGYLRAATSLFANVGRRNRYLFIGVDAGFGMIYSIFVLLVARLNTYRVVCAHHSSLYSTNRLARASVLFLVAGPEALHLVLALPMKEQLSQLYGKHNNFRIVNNAGWISAPKSISRGGGGGAPLTLGFLSNLSNDKGLDKVLALLSTALESKLAVRLHIAGVAQDAFARSQIQKAMAEHPESIDYAGYVDGETKAQFYAGIDIFVFPSRHRSEAQPLVLLEALANGIPIVTRDIGFVRDLVGNAGLVVPAEQDFVSFALQWIIDMSAAPGKFAEFRENARSRFDVLKLLSLDDFDDAFLRP